VNGSAEGFADYGVAIDPDRNWLASVMERAQRTINILRGPRANGRDAHIDDGEEEASLIANIAADRGVKPFSVLSGYISSLNDLIINIQSFLVSIEDFSLTPESLIVPF